MYVYTYAYMCVQYISFASTRSTFVLRVPAINPQNPRVAGNIWRRLRGSNDRRGLPSLPVPTARGLLDGPGLGELLAQVRRSRDRSKRPIIPYRTAAVLSVRLLSVLFAVLNHTICMLGLFEPQQHSIFFFSSPCSKI